MPRLPSLSSETQNCKQGLVQAPPQPHEMPQMASELHAIAAAFALTFSPIPCLSLEPLGWLSGMGCVGETTSHNSALMYIGRRAGAFRDNTRHLLQHTYLLPFRCCTGSWKGVEAAGRCWLVGGSLAPAALGSPRGITAKAHSGRGGLMVVREGNRGAHGI